MLISLLSVLDCGNGDGEYVMKDKHVTVSSFQNCQDATGFIFSEDVLSIADNTLYSVPYKWTTLDFRLSPCIIGHKCFSHFSRVCDVYIGPDVVSIGVESFFNYFANRFHVDEMNPNLILTNGLLIDRNKHLVLLSDRTQINHVIPDGITSIASLAFYLTQGNLYIPASVTTLVTTGYSQFNQKQGTITLGEGSRFMTDYNDQLLFDETTVFWGSTSLEGDIELPEVREIGFDAFKMCTKLTSIVLPKTVRDIAGQAFYQIKLGQLVIPKTVASVGPNAFYNAQIGTLTIESLRTTIRSSAFNIAAINCVRISCLDDPGKYLILFTNAKTTPVIEMMFCTKRFTKLQIRRYVHGLFCVVCFIAL